MITLLSLNSFMTKVSRETLLLWKFASTQCFSNITYAFFFLKPKVSLNLSPKHLNVGLHSSKFDALILSPTSHP